MYVYKYRHVRLTRDYLLMNLKQQINTSGKQMKRDECHVTYRLITYIYTYTYTVGYIIMSVTLYLIA